MHTCMTPSVRALFIFRDDHECEDDILPVRTIQQIESYLLSSVAVLKSYMTTGVRVTATEILALMSQVETDSGISP